MYCIKLENKLRKMFPPALVKISTWYQRNDNEKLIGCYDYPLIFQMFVEKCLGKLAQDDSA